MTDGTAARPASPIDTGPILYRPAGLALPDDLTHPDDFTEEQRAALRLLDEKMRAHNASRKPKNTRDGYDQDWEVWRKFCALIGLPVLAVTEGSLGAFAQWLWETPNAKTGKLSPYSTVDRRLSGVVVTARERYRVVLPKTIAAPARALLKDLRDQAEADEAPARGRGKANPFFPPHLRAAVALLPGTHAGLRDKSIALTHFQIAGREHELAWLRVRDFERTDKGMLVRVRVTKGGKGRSVPVEYSADPAVCAVRATFAWFEAAGIVDDRDGLAYRRCHNRWQTVMPAHGLSAEAIGDVIERTGARVEGAPRVTGHSPRRALAITARRAKRDRKWIADRGGWKPTSKAMEGYFEEADAWIDSNTNDLL